MSKTDVKHFPNLEMEIFKSGLTKKSIAEYLEISPRAFSNKLKNKNQFTINEAQKIQQHFFPSHSLEELFKEDHCNKAG